MSELPEAAVRRLGALLGEPTLIAGRYEVGAELGRGGMGVVRRAKDLVLGREVAVKILAVDAPAERFAELFRREFAILARLAHPGIVPIYDAGVLEDGRVFYVMRLVEGKRLDEFAEGGATRGELLRIVLRIADAIAFAHGQGVAHCDLKPANVMIGRFGEVLVLDWGIARLVAVMSDGPERAAGTPGYMAPEQESATLPVTERVDVYAIGIILGELMELHPEPIAKPLLSITGKATKQDVAARYANVVALADDIRRWIDGESVLAHREGAMERLGRFGRRHQTAILLVVAYVVIRTVILLWRGI